MEMCTGCIISAYVWASGVFALVWSQCQYLNLNIYGKYLVVWLSFMCKLLKAGGADRSRKSSAGVNDNGYSTDSVRVAKWCVYVHWLYEIFSLDVCTGITWAISSWGLALSCLNERHAQLTLTLFEKNVTERTDRLTLSWEKSDVH